MQNLATSKLRVCFGRKGGFQKNLYVNFNGVKFFRKLDHTNKDGNFFGYEEFDIPTKLVKKINKISINIPQTGGKISSIALSCSNQTIIE